MRKMLNTLYVTNPEAYITKDGLNIVVSIKQNEVMRIPIVNLENIITAGFAGASPGAMKLCVENSVGLAFVTQSGRFIARVQGPVHGNVYLRLRQYRLAEDQEFVLGIGRLMIAGKIYNSRAVLRRYIRDNGFDPDIEATSNELLVCKNKSLKCESEELLRGIEGDAASRYFGIFDKLILHQKDTFSFKSRSRRPPKDEVNVLLSYIYTLLGNDVTSALEMVGLDPCVGFIHKLRPGRKSLALDLIEEFRAYLCDRLVLSLINRLQISKKHFIYQTKDSLQLTDEGRKIIISAWQERKKQEIMHPFLEEKIPIGLLAYSQALLLARFVRGDLDSYPVFLLK